MFFAELRQELRALRTWKPGKLAKGTILMTIGIGLRTAGQAIVFIVVARLLGIEAYGAYAAVLALAGTIGSFGGFGVHTVMLRDISRNSSNFSFAWGRTLIFIGISAPVLAGIYLLTIWTILPAGISWTVITCVGGAELVFTPITLASINAFQGHERIGKAAGLVCFPIATRLVGVLILSAVILISPTAPPLELWAALYLFTAFFTAIYSASQVNHYLGRPQWPQEGKMLGNMKDGLFFAFSGAALKLYADIDKTMLARLSGFETAGLYSAAYRIMDMATIPIIAFLTTTLPRFFRESEARSQQAESIFWRLLPAPICYTACVGLLVYSAATWLPNILGSSYLPAVVAVQWLAWLPLVSLPRLILQTRLIAGDCQRAVVAVLAAGSALNILLNLLLIPQMSWRGAIIATYGAEVAMGLVLYRIAQRYLFRGKK